MTDKSDKEVVTIYWKDGSYTGELSDGIPHGKGTYTYFDEVPNDEYGWGPYEGDWKAGKKHGHGTMTSLDGSTTYVGEWKNDMLHGQGKWTDDLYIHIGEFRQDRFWEGNEYHSGDGNLEATYKNGVYHQVETTTDWREEEYADGSKFEGSYRKGKRNGTGVLFYPGGIPHQFGTFKDDELWEGTERDEDGNDIATYSEGIRTE